MNSNSNGNKASLFCCPVCGKELFFDGKSLRCENRHCFDISKEGYVNLLTGKGSAVSGDDKMMVSSRTLFLDGGYYAPLRDGFCNLINTYKKEGSVLLDSGCGEGYYTKEYANLVTSAAGIDISKAALKHAAKVCRNAEFAVASAYRLPVADGTVDIIVNCFSPMAPEEFARVLKKDGYLLYAVPGENHLIELKNILYDSPYLNEVKTEQYVSFSHVTAHHIKTAFTLTEKEKIMGLYRMTPYTWTTPKDGADRLSAVERLDVTAEFYIHVYKKI